MDLLEWPPKGNKRHPWEISRLNFFKKNIMNAHLNDRALKILDIGAGDGWFSREMLNILHPDSTIVCWDNNYNTETINQLSSITNRRIKYTSLRPQGKFDLLMLLDVLEHINDDKDFLSEAIKEHMGSNSLMLISIPAWPMLYSKHDLHLRHVRRYKPKKFKSLLELSGLEVLMRGGFFHSLLLPRLFSKILSQFFYRQRNVKDIGDWQCGHVLTRLIETALAFDNNMSIWLTKYEMDLPGLSWWALCKKRSL